MPGNYCLDWPEGWSIARTDGGLFYLLNADGALVLAGLDFCPFCGGRLRDGHRMVCTECGCTEDRACVTDDGPCHWVAPGRCSAHP
jgi:hypothetical protein